MARTDVATRLIVIGKIEAAQPMAGPFSRRGVLLGATHQNKYRQVLQAVHTVIEGRAIRPKSADGLRRAIVQPQRHLTSTDVAKIAEEYRAGGTLREIAKRWGINRETARLALARAGEPVREPGALSSSMLDEASRLAAEGWSMNKLGARFGIDPKTMKKRLSSTPNRSPAK